MGTGTDVVFVPDCGLSFDVALEVVPPVKIRLDPLIGVELTEDVLVSGAVFVAGVAVAAAASVRELFAVVSRAGSRFFFASLATGFFTGFGVVPRSDPVFCTEVVVEPEFTLAFDIGREEIVEETFRLDGGGTRGPVPLGSDGNL